MFKRSYYADLSLDTVDGADGRPELVAAHLHLDEKVMAALAQDKGARA